MIEKTVIEKSKYAIIEHALFGDGYGLEIMFVFDTEDEAEDMYYTLREERAGLGEPFYVDKVPGNVSVGWEKHHTDNDFGPKKHIMW